MNMAFSMTTLQMYRHEKTVTRRNGRVPRVGQIVWAVEKGQGIPKGGHVVRIGQIEILSVRKELLSSLIFDSDYGVKEVKLEGFDCEPMDFVEMYCKANKCGYSQVVSRVEFKPLYPKRESGA